MNIGEKIKALRTTKLMTQSELAGSEITRNMLSRIENGAAQPSLDTLRYLADRLKVSPGFLLSDAADEQLYVKREAINGIKTSFLTGDFRICRDICLNSGICEDDEVQLILAECTLEIAIEEFFSGNLHAACEYLDLALSACECTIYNTDHISSVCAVYFLYMREISATLSSNVIDETEAPICSAMNNLFCMYAADFIKFKNGEFGLEKLSQDKENPYSMHLGAITAMQRKEYGRGYELLHKILVSDSRIPDPMMYFVFCDLEICCREIEDFRGAYQYSMHKMELIQRLLS